MALRTFSVRYPGGSYPVSIGPEASEELPRILLEKKELSRIHLVSDSHVHGIHGKAIREILSWTDVAISESIVRAGETSKSVECLARLWSDIVQAGCDRQSCMIALGGGTVGDLTGFAAATVFRGIAFIQMPTTLLSMVDASIGGKTGVNLPEGKNLVGAFHQPAAVVMDTAFLGSLPERELRSGWAEVIKTAAIRDAALFDELETTRKSLLERDPDSLSAVIEKCVRIKAEVVESDEKEAGLRRILNFGHTLAHGLETAGGYAGLLHGEAVAVGMVFAAELGETLGVTAPGTARRLRACLESYGLPVEIRGIDQARILDAMAFDKKRGPSGVRWVLLPKLGDATVLEDVPPEVVRRQVERFAGA